MVQESAYKPASCKVYFDDAMVIVAAKDGPLYSWLSVLDLPVEDSLLGARIVTAWQICRRGGEPDSKTTEEIAQSERPIRMLFEAELLHSVPMVGANRVRGRIGLVSSELKGDDNRYFGERVELPLDADDAAIGKAAKQAMALTLS